MKVMKKPCPECPYTGACPGWIGSYKTAQHFHDFVKHDMEFTCHMNESRHCAGYVHYMNRMCKVSLRKPIRLAQAKFKLLPVDVKFSFDGSLLIETHGK